MSLLLAIKTFFKAFKDPKGAKKFLEGKEETPPSNESPHLRLLALLQHEGRLIDFLKEDIASFSDAQVGAAVRKIHSECSKSIEEFVTLRPLFQEKEGERITVPQGYDPSSIKVIGKVRGEPPYQGVLLHKGWKAHKLSLPKQHSKGDQSVVYPAEVEVK